MARKSRGKNRKKVAPPRREVSAPAMPKLGWQDNLTYGVVLAISFGILLCPLLLPLVLKDELAFRDPRVVAFGDRGGLWGLVPTCFLFFLWGIFAAVYWGQRYPIFGRKDISYGPPRYPSIYPLLWKNKPQVRPSRQETEQEKKETRTGILVLVVGLVISLALGGLAYCGRETLEREGTVAVYNALNRETERRTPEELATARVDTVRHKARRSTRWHYSLELCLEYTDGSTYRFALDGFRGEDLETLQTLLYLKEQYGPLFQVGDATYLRDVVADRDLTPEEETLLYRLFDREVRT